MANDDWRIRIEVEEEERASGFLERLTGNLGSEARELASNLESHRLAVSRDGETVFVYAATRGAAWTGPGAPVPGLRETAWREPSPADAARGAVGGGREGRGRTGQERTFVTVMR